MAQLEDLRNRINANDNLINQLLKDAEAAILDYTNRSELKPSMLGLQRELVIEYYNRLGSEGEASRSEGAISTSYSTEIPEFMKARLNNYRLLKASVIANAIS